MFMTSWAKDIKDKYMTGISNSFIVAGNIGDYAYETTLFTTYLENLLSNEFKMEEVAFYDLSVGTQYKKRTSDSASKDREGWGTMCEKLMDNNIKRTFIIRYPEFLIPTSGYSLSQEDKGRVIDLHKTLNSVAFLNSNNIVIFLTESVRNINNLFLNANAKTTLIDVDLPSEEERLHFINFSLGTVPEEYEDDVKHNLRLRAMVKEIPNQGFAKLTAGLNLIGIEDIILSALSLGKLTRNMILERKKELIRKEFGEIIEIFDTEGYSLDKFAGQAHIKQYFQDVVIDAIRDDELSIVPKGILLMGPPGTGKTYFSQCLAGDAGINFVEFKMSKILDKYVGESEKRLEKALSVFRALAPVGVFMDELDQTLSRGESDNTGVRQGLFGMFLAEMSKPENRGKIIWLGATNYPNRIDEALKRAGRFDKKIPFFAPSDEERRAVFKIHLNKHDLKSDDNIDIETLVSRTNGYTQAEIEGVVIKALELSKRSRLSLITQEKMMLALDYMLSAQNNRIQEMEDIALLECNDREFIPSEYLDRHTEAIKKNQESQ